MRNIWNQMLHTEEESVFMAVLGTMALFAIPFIVLFAGLALGVK